VNRFFTVVFVFTSFVKPTVMIDLLFCHLFEDGNICHALKNELLHGFRCSSSKIFQLFVFLRELQDLLSEILASMSC